MKKCGQKNPHVVKFEIVLPKVLAVAELHFVLQCFALFPERHCWARSGKTSSGVEEKKASTIAARNPRYEPLRTMLRYARGLIALVSTGTV